MTAIDITGRQVGMLTAVCIASGGSRKQKRLWLWTCACGAEVLKPSNHNAKSCGCLVATTNRLNSRRRKRAVVSPQARAKRGWIVDGSGSGQHDPTYRTWRSMHLRVKPYARCRRNYFDRGITVCERWLKFADFLADMGHRPSGLTLDRIDNDRGYEPGNCRWASMKEQHRNTRSNHFVEAFGQRRCIGEWAEVSGQHASSISKKLKAGYTPERAVTRARQLRIAS